MSTGSGGISHRGKVPKGPHLF